MSVYFKQQLACVWAARHHILLANIMVNRQQEITPQCLTAKQETFIPHTSQ